MPTPYRNGTSRRFALNWSRALLRRCLMALGVSASVVLTACTTQPPAAAPEVSASPVSPVTPVPSSNTASVGAMPGSVTPPPASTPPASAALRRPAPQAESTLGTQWGEGRDSQVQTIQAARLAPDQPNATVALRYSDEASIRRSLGASADRQLNVLMDGGKVEWSVRDAADRPLPIYSVRGRSGDFQVAGRHRERYELVYLNRSQRNYEVVATVDGLDVLTGQPGSVRSGGYLLRPGETLRIEGFRKSRSEVAAFRFSSRDNAYAANTPAGSPRNIGVIGTAVFEVRLGQTPPARGPNAFPADGGGRGDEDYAPPPRYR